MLDRRQSMLHVDRHLRAAREAMPPRLRRSFDGLLRERGLLADGPEASVAPLGHPVLELPVWVAGRLTADGADVPEDLVADVLGVSVLGYLHVRAQDDWLDAATREEPAPVALAETLIAFCDRLLVRVVGASTRYWDLHVEVLTAGAESVLQTAELRAGGAPVSRAAFGQLLAQSRPLVLPSAALLDRAGRWDLLAPLEEFVAAATATAQLFNDLTDLFRDRRAGHRTWTLQAVGESTLDDLWTELTGAPDAEVPGRLGERVAEALSCHERSARAAQVLVASAADGWLAERRAVLEGLPEALRAALGAAFVRHLTGSGAATAAPLARRRGDDDGRVRRQQLPRRDPGVRGRAGAGGPGLRDAAAAPGDPG